MLIQCRLFFIKESSLLSDFRNFVYLFNCMKIPFCFLIIFCSLTLQNFAQSSLNVKKQATKKVAKPSLQKNKDTLLISYVGDTLFASVKAESYQWLNCNANAGPIPGAVERFFLPEVPGLYAVQISLKGKVDTSACVVASIAQERVEQIPGLKIYPNPSNGVFMITVPDEMLGQNYKVLNSMGEIIMESKTSRQFRVNLLGYPDAQYFLMFESHKIKLVKLSH